MPPRIRAKPKKVSRADVPKDLNQLEYQLQKFLRSNNQGIAEATQVLKAFINSISSVPLLIERVSQPGSDPHTRQLAAVLLCKRISRYWVRMNTKAGRLTKVGSNVQLYRNALLSILESGEAPPQVIHSVSYLVSIIGRIDLSKKRWPQLVDWISHTVTSGQYDNINKLDAGLRVVRSLLTSRSSSHLQPFFDSYLQCFVFLINHDETPTHIRSRAVMALDALFKAFDEETDSQKITGTFDVLIRALGISLNAYDGDTVNTILEILTQSVETTGFDELIGTTFPAVLSVLENTELDLKLRTQAAEFIQQYISVKPANFTKPLGVMDANGRPLRLLDITLGSVYKLLIEEDDNPFDQSEQTPQKIGVNVLEFLLRYLARNEVFTPLVPQFFELVGNMASEHHRKAAYVIIMCLSEGAPALLTTYTTTQNGQEVLFLETLISFACQSLLDPSPIVRTAVCLVLTWFGEFIGHILAEHGLLSRAVESILGVLQQDCDADFRNKLMMALDSFVESMGSQVVAYLEPIMHQMNKQFAHFSIEVRESAISTIRSIAMSSQEHFLPYFKPILQVLKNIVLTPEKEGEGKLRTGSLIAISAIARAVGIDSWDTSDSQVLFEITKNVIALSHSSDDVPVRESALVFLGNMVSALSPAIDNNTDIQQIANETFNFCIRTINSLEGIHFQNNDADAPKLAGFDDDDDDDEDDEEGPNQAVPPMLSQNLSMDVLSANASNGEDDDDIVIEDDGLEDEDVYFETEVLELKSSALSTLSMLLTSLGPKFAHLQCEILDDPGAEEVPSDPIGRTIHVILEATAYLSGHYLLSCFYTMNDIMIVLNQMCPVNPEVGVRKPLPDAIKRLVLIMVSRYLDVLEEEDDPDLVSAVLDQLNTLFPIYGISLIHDEAVPRFYDAFSAILHESSPCQMDDEYRDLSSEHGEDVLETACELLGTMIQHYGPLLKTEFIDPNNIIECLLNYCDDQRPDSFRALSIGSLGEIIELSGPAAVDFIPAAFPVGIKLLRDHSNATRHNAVYFVGECALVAAGKLDLPQDVIRDSYSVMLQHIIPQDQMASSSEDQRVTHDNAVTSAIKFAISWPSIFPPAEVFPSLFSLLPLVHDTEEPAKVVMYAKRAMEIDMNVMIPLLPNIFRQIAIVFQTKVIQIRADLKPEIIQFVQALLAQRPEECSHAFSQLDAAEQQELSQLIQPQ